jgi:hypothetical protein
MKKLFTVLGIVSCITAFAQPVPELLYYKFDSTSPSVTVPNWASSPPPGTNNATIMGGLTQGPSGQCGNAIIGSGNSSSTDYVNTGYATNLTGTSWTISFWTKDITPSTTLFYIFGDGTASSFRCFTNGVAGANNWILRGGLTDVLLTGGATVAPHMNTFVYDMAAGNIKAYRDGVLINTVTQAGPTIAGTGPFKVIGYNTNVGCPAGGKLDEFRLYNRALSQAEITQLYTHNETSSFSVTACNSYTVPSGDETYTMSGTYNDTIPRMYCGDSIMTINVTINNPTTSSFSVTNCDSYTVPSGDETYTVSGVYNDTIPNSIGCDSIMTITVNINNSTTSSFSVSSCNSYTVPSGDETYTVSGTYNDTIPNSAGCDSIMTINVTINNPPVVTLSGNTSICAGDSTLLAGTTGVSHQWYMNGMPINGATTDMYYASQAGLFNMIMTDANGCSDSAATGIAVTVNALPSVTYNETQTMVCVTITSMTLTAGTPSGGTYSGTAVTGNTFDPSTAGAGTFAIVYTYTDGNNCTSSDTSMITVDLCTGINEMPGLSFSVFPNPGTGIYTITTSGTADVISITDVLGREVLSVVPVSVNTELNLRNEMDGVYFVTVISDGKRSVKRLVLNK